MQSLNSTQSAIGNSLRGFKERNNMIRFLFIKATMDSTRRLGWREMLVELGKPEREQLQKSRGDMVMA